MSFFKVARSLNKMEFMSSSMSPVKVFLWASSLPMFYFPFNPVQIESSSALLTWSIKEAALLIVL